MVMAAPDLAVPRREEVRSNAEAALPPPQELDERTLVEALKAGDEAAFDALVRRHESAMLRIALAHVGSRARAEEVVQDTWLAVIRGLPRFRGESTLKTWIFRVLLNRARTRGRREARTLPLTDLEVDTRLDADAIDRLVTSPADAFAGRPERSPLRAVLDGELRARIDGAIEQLPERQRTVITLRDVEGWSAEEVCNALGISETNQRVLLHRARSRIRREMAPYIEDSTPHRDDYSSQLR